MGVQISPLVPFMGMWRNWERNCFASKRLWVRVPSFPPVFNRVGGLVKNRQLSLSGLMVECHLAKVETRVRFSSKGPAGVVELVDTLLSKSSIPSDCEGSTPSLGTN